MAASAPGGIARMMTYLAWVAALGLATLWFGNALEQQRNPNRDLTVRGDGTVVLQRNRQGHYVVTARVNGQDVETLLDTGATRVSVPEALARRLQLPRGPGFPAMTANGVVTGYDTVLDSVQVGAITLHRVAAAIIPGSGVAQDQVLLGMSFLKRLDFSQQGDKLVLRPPG